MAQEILYALITLIACILGTLGGIGGGIIIKPLLDLLNDYPLANIGLLSSVTVLTMSFVSIIHMRRHLKGISLKNIGILSFGSIIGGIIGGKLFTAIQIWSGQEHILGIIQSAILLFLIFLVLLEELFKHLLKGHAYDSTPTLLTIGGILGAVSSFLGVGGGPFNRPVLSHFLGFAAKSATVGSLCIIFFSQAANISHIALTTGFSAYDLSMLPYMVGSAFFGGLVGGSIVNVIRPKIYDRLFFYVILLIMAVNIINLVRYIGI